MRGIDISNWQAGIVPSSLGVDFCIVKATEGIGYVDPYCDGFVQDCINNSVLWGFYHFARENEPETEAEYFYENCKNYFGHGIPVLDYETSNYNNREWCERFIQRLYDLSGIWCLIYLSASRCGEYEGSWIPDYCGLWVAGYPMPYTSWIDEPMPYNTYPFNVVAIWQFTSTLNLGGWSLDGNIAYMDAKAWGKYANPQAVQNADSQPGEVPASGHSGKTCEELAHEVIAGKWGNGWNRQQALDSTYGAGTYDHVQCIVNELLGLDGC